MPATIQQVADFHDTEEPETEGPDWAQRWNAWAQTPHGREELRRQAIDALDFYDRIIKPRHEPHDNGKYIVVERHSKEYEIAPSSIEARKNLRSRGVEGQFVTMEVGHPLVRMSHGPIRDLRRHEP